MPSINGKGIILILLSGQNESDFLSEEEASVYRAIVGSLNYLAWHSRPDISFAVQQLSRHMHKPTHSHWSALSRVFGLGIYCVLILPLSDILH